MTQTRRGRRSSSISDLIVEKSALTSLDSGFLFTFTIIVFFFTLLNIYIGTLGGLLPLLVVTVCLYPFFIGTYRGIMLDDLCERLAAWHFLILLIGLVGLILATSPIMTIIRIVTAYPWMTAEPPWSNYLSIVLLFLELIAFAFIVPWTVWKQLVRVYSHRLPRRRNAMNIKRRNETFSRHWLFGGLFTALSITLTTTTYFTMISNLDVGIVWVFDPSTFFLTLSTLWIGSSLILWVWRY